MTRVGSQRLPPAREAFTFQLRRTQCEMGLDLHAQLRLVPVS